MVKHHVKKKNNTKSSKKRKLEEEKALEKKLKDLDRFAGSSDEENDDDHDDDNDDDDSLDDYVNYDADIADDGESDDERRQRKKAEKQEKSSHSKRKNVPTVTPSSRNDEKSSDEASSSSSDESTTSSSSHYSPMTPTPIHKNTGLANAMSQILSQKTATTTPKTTKNDDKKHTPPPPPTSIILSKTTTKLQKALENERRLQNAERAKKRESKNANAALRRLHAPLPKGAVDAESGTVSKEWEKERTLRRVATRGVVALFNAIARHQADAAAGSKVGDVVAGKKKGMEGKGGAVTAVTSKQNFLEMIKKSAVKETKAIDSVGSVKRGRGVSVTEKVMNDNDDGEEESGGGWNALQDDFLTSRNNLKDWDKEILSEDESDNDQANNLVATDDLSDME